MPPFSPDAIASLLEPYVGAAVLPYDLYSQLTVYLELILKWNVRINLTAIRDPGRIVQRHFGESLFAGLQVDPNCDSLLDLGSGAGFPGVPIQLLKPDLAVTLAESRGRKAAFLREVIRELGLKTVVWADRVENMPAKHQFHTVALRAVDEMNEAVVEASMRASREIVILGINDAVYSVTQEFRMEQPIPLPNSSNGAIWTARRLG